MALGHLSSMVIYGQLEYLGKEQRDEQSRPQTVGNAVKLVAEPVMRASPKLRRWYDRQCEYKKAELVWRGLRRRVFAEIYPLNHEGKMAEYRRFLERQKKKGEIQKIA
jgi:hypothetical protein